MSTVYEDLEEEGVRAGRQLSPIKQSPKGEVVFWNACIFDSHFVQVWWGDFNVTTESEAVQQVANLRKEILYVTREIPFRFDGLTKKDVKREPEERVLVFKPEGTKAVRRWRLHR